MEASTEPNLRWGEWIGCLASPIPETDSQPLVLGNMSRPKQISSYFYGYGYIPLNGYSDDLMRSHPEIPES